MNIPLIKLVLATSAALVLSNALTSCGAPDPTLQKEMDRDILSASENKAPGNTTGPQQGQGARNYGHGGF